MIILTDFRETSALQIATASFGETSASQTATASFGGTHRDILSSFVERL